MKKIATKVIRTLVPLALLASVAIPVMAQGTISAPTTQTAPAPKVQPTINVACIQAAIEKRDTAIIAAVDAHATALKAAISARKNALKAAWAKPNRKDRRDAIRDSWKAFRDAQKAARKAYRLARQAAWQAYETDRKACGRDAVRDDMTGRGADELSE